MKYVHSIYRWTKSLVGHPEYEDELKKMAPKQEGPFKIEEVLGLVTYRLKLPTTWKIHNIFHAVLLKPYVETEVHGENFSRPIPEILDGEEVYNVETILKH
jgi:hypothetical protein